MRKKEKFQNRLIQWIFLPWIITDFPFPPFLLAGSAVLLMLASGSHDRPSYSLPPRQPGPGRVLLLFLHPLLSPWLPPLLLWRAVAPVSGADWVIERLPHSHSAGYMESHPALQKGTQWLGICMGSVTRRWWGWKPPLAELFLQSHRVHGNSLPT